MAQPVARHMNKCHIDIESFSEEKLKKSGLFRYAEHPSTEVLVICYGFDDGPVNMYVPWGVHAWQPENFPAELYSRLINFMDDNDFCGELNIRETIPDDLREHVKSGRKCLAHNAQFERTMLNGHPGQKIGFPVTQPAQWICTAAKAAAHALPRALEHAAKALGTRKKDILGKQDMLALCKPRSGIEKRYDIETKEGAHRYFNLFKYCVDDVRAETDIDVTIPDLSPLEQKVWVMDQEINDRGVEVDLEAVANLQILIKEYKIVLEKACFKITGFRPSQTERISEWIADQGYLLENLQAPTMKLALEDDECPVAVKKVISIRMLHSMKAVSKYTAIEKAVCKDNKLHGMFLYHGAGTGRWSSVIVQLQNLFRPVIADPDTAIEAFEALDLEWISELYAPVNPMKVFASCVRGVLVPADGKDLLAMDYSAIEARVIAWLAGQMDILEVFKEHGKVYEFTAAKIYSMSTDISTLKAMKKAFPDRRFVGKIAVLALGYQGGKSAFAKMANNYGVDIHEEQAEKIKVDWRQANPKIVNLWGDLEEAAKAAVRMPGEVFAIPNGKILFKVVGEFLYMRLPSGRRLAYFKPEMRGRKLTYLGVDTYTRRWTRCDTYGGKLAENATQAIARDLLVHAMFRLRTAQYDIIGTVHDEVILELLESFGSEEEVSRIMCILPKWAAGLPVKAEGFRGKRYRK